MLEAGVGFYEKKLLRYLHSLIGRKLSGVKSVFRMTCGIGQGNGVLRFESKSEDSTMLLYHFGVRSSYGRRRCRRRIVEEIKGQFVVARQIFFCCCWQFESTDIYDIRME